MTSPVADGFTMPAAGCRPTGVSESLWTDLRRSAWRRGVEGRFDAGPGHTWRQEDRDDVCGMVPGLELLADLVAGSVGGELVEHDLRLGGDGPAPRAGARVRGDDRPDLCGIALAGHGPGVDLAHGTEVPGGAGGNDVTGRAGAFAGGGNRSCRYGEGPGAVSHTA